MKIKTFICFSICLAASQLRAQTVIDSSVIITDRLYELAWENYPANRMKEHMASKAYYGYKHAKLSWTNDIAAQFNLNEANINPNAAPNIFYPKYQIGLQVKLGTFLLTPIETKRMKEEYNAALSDVDLQRILIRNQVVRNIQQYKLARNLLKVKTQILEESDGLMRVVRQKFQNNEVTIEDYNKGNIIHLQLIESKLSAEAQFSIAKNELETLVGARLETLKLPSNF